MKMTSSNEWNKRPLVSEEIESSTSPSARVIATIFAIVFVASAVGFGLMLIIHILHRAEAISWSLSFRDSQLIAVIALIIRGLVIARES